MLFDYCAHVALFIVMVIKSNSETEIFDFRTREEKYPLLANVLDPADLQVGSKVVPEITLSVLPMVGYSDLKSSSDDVDIDAA